MVDRRPPISAGVDAPLMPNVGAVYLFVRNYTMPAPQEAEGSVDDTTAMANMPAFMAEQAAEAATARAVAEAEALAAAEAQLVPWNRLRPVQNWGRQLRLMPPLAERDDFYGGSVALSLDATAMVVGATHTDYTYVSACLFLSGRSWCSTAAQQY